MSMLYRALHPPCAKSRMGQEHASQDMLADSIGAKLSAALGWDKILPSAMDPADFASGDAVQAILLGDGSSSNPDSR